MAMSTSRFRSTRLRSLLGSPVVNLIDISPNFQSTPAVLLCNGPTRTNLSYSQFCVLTKSCELVTRMRYEYYLLCWES